MHVLGILFIVLILASLPAAVGVIFGWISGRVRKVTR